MEVIRYTLGPVATNCYIVVNDQKKGLLIDPAAPSPKVIEVLEQMQIEIQGILLTHAHFDHIGGLEKMREITKAPVYMHEKEKEWIKNPSLNGSGRSPWKQFVPEIICKDADVLLKADGKIQIGDFELNVLHTPGHSPGSISFAFEGIIFCGDTLFYDSIGRTDLLEGNLTVLLTSIKEKLLSFPDETIIYPGHGEQSTIGRERKYNPFLVEVM